jgi:hypothetical protein
MRRDGGSTDVTIIAFHPMPQLSHHSRFPEARSPRVAHPLATDMRPRPPRLAPAPPLLPSRVVPERVAAVAVQEPPREPTPLALAKPKPGPPPLPPAARPNRVTPPPLPAAAQAWPAAVQALPAAAQALPATAQALPAAVQAWPPVQALPAAMHALPAAVQVTTDVARPFARSTRDEEIPDFLNGAARRRRVLLMVSAVAGLALLAAVIASIASHYRPM